MDDTDSPSLVNRFRDEARRLGFDALGIAPAVAPPGYESYRRWLDDGHAAGMGYMHRQADARAHPSSVLDGVRSIIMTAMVYGGPTMDTPEGAKIARYARGDDYHDLFWERLDLLLRWLEAERPGIKGRGVADSAPLMERDYARMAGLGWIGKNTMLLSRKLGSFTLLGALLIDAELPYDAPHESSHCGTCTRCLDACPTDAFVAPYQLDANRCLSYWTIEHRGAIPDTIAERSSGWVFGCDICQDVCPWNRKAAVAREPRLIARPDRESPDLVAWFSMDDAAFRAAFRGSAMTRAKRAGLLRNAAIVLGERRRVDAASCLISGLTESDAGLRAACAWALGRIGTPECDAALATVLNDEDPTVRDAVRRALNRRDGEVPAGGHLPDEALVAGAGEVV